MKKLERSLSLTSVVAISIGGMLGSGIFVLPGLASAKTGQSLWLAYLLSAICILPAALSKSELATAMPSSGGTYVYIERTFGPLFGTIAGLGLWLSLLLKSSFALVGIGAYLMVIVNLPFGLTKYVALIFLVLIGSLNILGIKKVGKIQLFIVLLSLTGLFGLLMMCLPFLPESTDSSPLLHGYVGLFETVAFVFVSYAGVTKVAAIAGEIKDPDKNLPKGMMIALISVTIVYIAITYLLVHVVPLNELATDIKPIYTLTKYVGGETLGIIAGVIGVITLFSMANSGVLASSRFPYAMGQDRLLPKKIGTLSSKYLTPINAIIATCLTITCVILFLEVEKIAKLASAFMVFMFIMVNASVIVLRETGVQWYKPSYHSPLYPIMQIFGIISGLILLIFLGLMPTFSIILITIIGFFVYTFYGSKRMARTGLIRKYGHRPASLMFGNKNSASKNSKIINTNYQTEKLVSNVNTVVPLFGNESSPEMITEIASAINGYKPLQVVCFREVPNQTDLDDIKVETPKINSIQRRIGALAEEKNISLSFELTVTHDLSGSMHELSDHSACEWMVAGWNGRAYNGILIKNPLGWLLTNLNSNLALFKDEGVRYFRRILLPIRAGRDITDFLKVALKISQFYNAELCLLHVVSEHTTKTELNKLNTQSKNIIDQYDYPCGINIVKSNDPSNTINTISSDFDLVIIGTPQKDNWISVLFGTGRDKIAENSACSVLRLSINKNID